MMGKPSKGTPKDMRLKRNRKLRGRRKATQSSSAGVAGIFRPSRYVRFVTNR